MWSTLVRRWRARRDAVAHQEPAAGASPAAPAPGLAPAAHWIALGNDALARSRPYEALQAYAAAKASEPAHAAAWLNHGFACLETGDIDTALADFQQCLALAAPGDRVRHEAQFLIGRARLAQGQPEQAASAFEAALAAAPGFEEARIALAELWLEAGTPQRVPELAAAAPTVSEPLALLHAQALHALGRLDDALALVEALLVRNPDSAAALDGRGVLQLDLDRPAEALASFERALQAGGENADRLANLAAACQRLARLDEAVAHADRALALSPDNARARWNRALSHLLRGELARGWEDFEARWEAGVVAGQTRLRSHGPRWQGEDLRGRSILLDVEQGIGDTIQFLRYVPELAARGARVAVRVQRPLVRLARYSLPQHTVLALDDAAPPTDFYCELMSVPRHAGIHVDAIPAAVPYLHPEPAAAKEWEQRLAAAAQGRLRVGLVWSGNPAHLNDRNRSIPLQHLLGLADVDALFVGLKPDPGEADRATYAAWPGFFDAGPQLTDFADTAAAVQALDLLVCVDTSVAHLAGALGRPLWLLLPWLPDWRWMLGREDSPWYPGARLYRQARPHDWSEPLRRLREDLQRLAAARRP